MGTSAGAPVNHTGRPLTRMSVGRQGRSRGAVEGRHGGALRHRQQQAGDLPGSLRALFKHEGLGVPEGDDLAAAHLTVAEVDEAHGLTQMQLGAHRQASARIGQHAFA